MKLRVEDEANQEFFAEPSGAFFKEACPAGEDPNFRTGVWWFNPNGASGFVEGETTVELEVIAPVSPGTSKVFFRSLCCDKFRTWLAITCEIATAVGPPGMHTCYNNNPVVNIAVVKPVREAPEKRTTDLTVDNGESIRGRYH